MHLEHYLRRDRESGRFYHKSETVRCDAINYMKGIQTRIYWDNMENRDRISHEALHYAIELFDVLDLDCRVHLVCVVCLMIGGKMHDTSFMSITDCLHFDKQSKEYEVLEMERFILNFIDYRMYIPTVYNISMLLAEKQCLDLSLLHLLHFELCDVVYTSETRLLRACSINHHCAKFMKLSDAWPENMQSQTGIKRVDLLPLDARRENMLLFKAKIVNKRKRGWCGSFAGF